MKDDTAGNTCECPGVFIKMLIPVFQGHFFGITVTTAVGGTLKTEILVNDKAVDTKTFSGTSYIHGITSYQFP